jgi:SpoVK/Ycf46/Vps4 family AAA+-type ATPase
MPIEAEKAEIANGGRLRPTTPMSAILFGPPGTSKTELAKLIARFLGWPLLSVDPSYLVQDGLDRLYARANRLFSMLGMVEQVVVLLDEFDEMGRDRSQSSDLLSRFITTSMLPKLAAINKERKIVFLLATNYVSHFDAAFSRGGRFDMILQVMPPTAAAKQSFSDWSSTLGDALQTLSGRKRSEAEDCLADLTYLETQQLVFALNQRPEDIYEVFKNARDRGTMKRLNGDKTWKETCKEEEAHIRLPAVPQITQSASAG